MELMISIVPYGTFASFFCYLYAILLLLYCYPYATLLLSLAVIGVGVDLIDFFNYIVNGDPKYQLERTREI